MYGKELKKFLWKWCLEKKFSFFNEKLRRKSYV